MKGEGLVGAILVRRPGLVNAVDAKGKVVEILAENEAALKDGDVMFVLET